jgi:hypothetical protein
MGAAFDEGPLNLNNDEHSLVFMQVMLKGGNISNVLRPYKLADKWCDVLCEGDSEKAKGMEFTKVEDRILGK